jgi:F0F1-type ATP synthase assembly protein I
MEGKPPTDDGDGGELGPAARAERAAAPYLSAASRVVGGILLGAGAGWFADEKLHSSPWGLIVGLMVGLGVGFYGLFLALRTMGKR